MHREREIVITDWPIARQCFFPQCLHTYLTHAHTQHIRTGGRACPVRKAPIAGHTERLNFRPRAGARRSPATTSQHDGRATPTAGGKRLHAAPIQHLGHAKQHPGQWPDGQAAGIRQVCAHTRMGEEIVLGPGVGKSPGRHTCMCGCHPRTVW